MRARREMASQRGHGRRRHDQSRLRRSSRTSPRSRRTSGSPFYPEKRPFFPKASISSTPIQAVHAHYHLPRWGIRGTGKIDSTNHRARHRGPRGGTVVVPGAELDVLDQDFSSLRNRPRAEGLRPFLREFLATDREIEGPATTDARSRFQWAQRRRADQGPVPLLRVAESGQAGAISRVERRAHLRPCGLRILGSLKQRYETYISYQDISDGFRADDGSSRRSASGDQAQAFLKFYPVNNFSPGSPSGRRGLHCGHVGQYAPPADLSGSRSRGTRASRERWTTSSRPSGSATSSSGKTSGRCISSSPLPASSGRFPSTARSGTRSTMPTRALDTEERSPFTRAFSPSSISSSATTGP